MKKNNRKIIINYIYNVLLQIFNIIVPLVTTPYISRVLGAKQIGVYSYTLSISTYFIVMGSLGIPLYGQREVAFRSMDVKKRSILFFQLIYCQIALIVIASFAYIFFVSFFVDDNKSVYYAQVIGIIGGGIATSWFYAGIEEFKITVFKNILVKLFSIVGLFIFIKDSKDVVLYTAIIGLANVIGNITIIFGLNKYVDFSLCRIDKHNVIKHIKPAFIMGIPYYVTSIYAVIDKTMLGILSKGFHEVGYYEQSQKIIILAMTVVNALGTVLMPRMALEIEMNNDRNAVAYLKKGIDISILLSAPICVGIVFLASITVPWFFGHGYDEVVPLLFIFSPLVIIIGISNLIGMQYLVVLKMEKKLTQIMFISVFINLFFNWWLIPVYDAKGAAVATIISEMIKLFILIRVVKELSVFEITQKIVKYVGCSVVMGSGIFAVKKFLLKNHPSFINTLILIIVGMVSHIMILFVTRDNYVIVVKNKMKKMCFNKRIE